MKNPFKEIEVEKGKLLREVRIFVVEKDLPLTVELRNGKNVPLDYVYRKGDVLEEMFDKPNCFVNTSQEDYHKKMVFMTDTPFISKSYLSFEGAVKTEDSNYFKDYGIEKIVKEKRRKGKQLSKINDRLAEINYLIQRTEL